MQWFGCKTFSAVWPGHWTQNKVHRHQKHTTEVFFTWKSLFFVQTFKISFTSKPLDFISNGNSLFVDSRHLTAASGWKKSLLWQQAVWEHHPFKTVLPLRTCRLSACSDWKCSSFDDWSQLTRVHLASNWMPMQPHNIMPNAEEESSPLEKIPPESIHILRPVFPWASAIWEQSSSFSKKSFHWIFNTWEHPLTENNNSFDSMSSQSILLIKTVFALTTGHVRAVGWLLNTPATNWSICGTDLLRQVYILPNSDRSCRSNFLSH